MVGKAQKSHGARSGLYGGYSNGVPPSYFFQTEHRIQFRSRPIRYFQKAGCILVDIASSEGVPVLAKTAKRYKSVPRQGNKKLEQKI
jgi:hypothetical protein